MADSNPEPESDRKRQIHAVLSFVIALALLLVALGGAVLMFITREQAKQSEPERAVPTVVAMPVVVGRHEVRLESEGVVESRREVQIDAEVAGRVIRVSPELVEGGRISEGDLLAEIDDADYRAALERAEAQLADARLALEVEKARGEQARRDWEKLGRGDASPLVLRKPQILSAESAIESAVADVERARRDVERTKIRAPFSGRVRSDGVEVGAVVAPGGMVAEIYSDTELEVMLPFSLRDFGYLRGTDTPRFELRAALGGEEQRWPAELARVSGEVERETLSGFAIARVVESPAGYPPVGLFVEAELAGSVLDAVAEIPRASVRGSDEVWVVRDGRLHRERVEVLRSNRETLVVRGAFEVGDRLLLTRLATPVEGMEVKIKGGEDAAEGAPETAATGD